MNVDMTFRSQLPFSRHTLLFGEGFGFAGARPSLVYPNVCIVSPVEHSYF